MTKSSAKTVCWLPDRVDLFAQSEGPRGTLAVGISGVGSLNILGEFAQSSSYGPDI